MASVKHGFHPGCAVLAVVMACASGGTALAQGGSGADARRRQASDHVKKGDAFKEARDFEAAAREYEKAYELVPHPVLIFNLGQVYRLKGDAERALDYYERYLAVEPDGVASDQAREFAGVLRTQIERERTRESVPDRPAKRTTPVPAPRPAAPADEGAGRGLRIGGLVSAGAGVIAVGVGIKFGLDARSISDDINAHGDGQPWPEELLDRQVEGKRAERAMFLLTGVGAAAIVTGGVLYYLGHRARRQTERVAVTPVATGSELGVVVLGQF
jgi:tetratricopeptide (TPR) repeat protein